MALPEQLRISFSRTISCRNSSATMVLQSGLDHLISDATFLGHYIGTAGLIWKHLAPLELPGRDKFKEGRGVSVRSVVLEISRIFCRQLEDCCQRPHRELSRLSPSSSGRCRHHFGHPWPASTKDPPSAILDHQSGSSERGSRTTVSMATSWCQEPSGISNDLLGPTGFSTDDLNLLQVGPMSQPSQIHQL